MAAVTETINYDSFLTSTLKKYKPELKKNFIESRPGVNLLMDDYGHEESGGYAVQLRAEFGNNNNTKFISPYDQVPTTPSEYALPMLYQWRHMGSAATVSEIEKAANSGKEKMFDLLDGRIRQAVRSSVNLTGSEIYSDGTSFGGNTIIGLAAGISTTPTVDPASGPVGGIDAPSHIWWQNNAITSAGSFAANGVGGATTDLVITMYNNCTDGMMDRPSGILSGQDVYEDYNRSLTSTVRTLDPHKRGDLAFESLDYHGIAWTWDRQCPSGRMYFVNAKHVYFIVDPSMMFEWYKSSAFPGQVVDIGIMR